MKTILYVITNISMPSLCKVGITDNLDRRLNDLNKTGVPTRFQVYESFELENAELLEQDDVSLSRSTLSEYVTLSESIKAK